MNEINFLPESFYRQRARRRRVWRHALALTLVAAGLITWGVLGDRSLQSLRSFARQIETEGEAAHEQVKEVVRLQGEFLKLAKTLAVQRDVALPVSCSKLVATVTHLMPATVVLTDLNMDAARPTPTQKAPEADKKGKKAAPKKGAAPVAAPKTDTMRIELKGLSPDDARIADFVGRLTDCPAFTNVKLEYARVAEIEGMTGRQFRVSLMVRLDRDYLPLDARKDLAHAD